MEPVSNKSGRIRSIRTRRTLEVALFNRSPLGIDETVAVGQETYDRTFKGTESGIKSRYYLVYQWYGRLPY